MPWTDPVNTDWETNDIPTQTQILEQILDNLRHLRGQDGITTLEGDQNPDANGTLDIGTAALRWLNIFGRHIYAGRYRVSPTIREVRITWEGALGRAAAFTGTGAGASASGDGTGQIALEVNDDAAATGRLDHVNVSTVGKNADWAVGNTPYFRFEFSLNVARATSTLFLGFRATPSSAIPVLGESHAGLRWDGTAWTMITSASGGAAQSQTTVTVADNQRHVLEIYVNGTTSVEFWLDGTLIATHTTNLPTGDLEWSHLVITDGLGGATQSILTLGELILQESLA